MQCTDELSECDSVKGGGGDKNVNVIFERSLVEYVVEGGPAGVVCGRHGVHDGVERPRHQEAVGAEALPQLVVAV